MQPHRDPGLLHPAYVSYLAAASAALAPVLDQLVDVPGAPSRIEQTTPTFRWTDDGGEATAPSGTIRGTPPVCTIVLPNQNGGLSLSIDQSADQVRDQTVRTLVAAVVGTGSDSARRAVTAVILGSSRLALDAPIAAAAQRFAVLPASTRHAWLIAHAADLRAGRITLEQLP